MSEADQRGFYGLEGGAIERLVREMVDGDLSVVSGGVLDQFEREAALLLGARHAVAAANGTAALHLAFFAIDLRPGDEVLVPTYGYYAFVVPVCMMGGIPVFCDVEEGSLAIDPDDARRMVTDRTRAILAHQPWGCPADADALRLLADEHGLALIADASHALGALWNGRPLGEQYDLTCASLGRGKLVSGGELGVVATNDDLHRDRMLIYGHVNRVPGALITDQYRHLANSVGMKYRPHAFAMALALKQLETYPERLTRLVRNVRRFEEGLAGIEGFLPQPAPAQATRVYWRVSFRFDSSRFPDPDRVISRLTERGCPVERHREAPLIHECNVVTGFWGVRTGREFPVAARARREVCQLPAFALYREGEVERFLDIFREVSRE